MSAEMKPCLSCACRQWHVGRGKWVCKHEGKPHRRCAERGAEAMRMCYGWEAKAW